MAETFIPTGNNALSFSFPTHSLRVVMRDGEPWFVAADLLDALTLDRKALERLDDDEKGVNIIHTPGGQQEMTIINESGLYSLVLTSRKPEAKKFKKWVTSEVLPAIRKNGRYESAQAAVSVPQAPQLLEVIQELSGHVTTLMNQVARLSRKVITTQGQLIRSQKTNIVLVEGRMDGAQASATIVQMHRDGHSNAQIVAATGRNTNHVRQTLWQARRDGVLPPLADAASTASAQANLFKGA